MSDDIEKEFSKSNGLKDTRKLAEDNDRVEPEVLNSVKNTIDLVTSLFHRLKLKDRPFLTQDPATFDKIEEFRNELLRIHDTLLKSDITKAKVLKRTSFMDFLRTHCYERH